MDKSALYDGYSFFSTIILYGFGNAEHDFLAECISSMIVDDKIKKHKCRVRIIDTDEITDIIAIPSMISIINSEKLSTDDTNMIIDFFGRRRNLLKVLEIVRMNHLHIIPKFTLPIAKNCK